MIDWTTIGFLGAVAGVTAIVIAQSWFTHQQEMARIERGIYDSSPDNDDTWTSNEESWTTEAPQSADHPCPKCKTKWSMADSAIKSASITFVLICCLAASSPAQQPSKEWACDPQCLQRWFAAKNTAQQDTSLPMVSASSDTGIRHLFMAQADDSPVLATFNSLGDIWLSPRITAVCPAWRLRRNMRAGAHGSKRAIRYIEACTRKVKNE